MNNDNLKGLHGTLIKEGYNPPEYEQFAKDMEDDANLQGVYETLKREGYTPPSYDEFKSDMGFGQSAELNPTEATDSTGQSETPNATGEQTIDPGLDVSAKLGASAGAEAVREKPSPDTVPGTQEWRANTVNIPGENPYNGRTYGEVYDSIISDYGKNLAHPDIDPYAEARAQIMQSGIADDMKPEDADNLALNIREGYANRYADNGAKQMIASLPDQVPNIDQLMDGLWYTRDMQGRIAHEARRLGLRTENYVNYYVKPHIAKALSDRYGYDVDSAKHIAARLLSQEGHTMERVRQNEAAEMIGRYAEPKIQAYFDKALQNAEQQFADAPKSAIAAPEASIGLNIAAAADYYRATDPAKVWDMIKPDIDKMSEDIIDKDFILEAEKHAEEEGVDIDSWMESRVVPMMQSQIQSQFEQMAIEREMPKNTMDYILANMQQSLMGTVARAILESKTRRRMKAEALQRTEAGQGVYNPGFGAKVAGGAAAMLPDMLLPYGGPFGLTAKWATKPVQGMAQTLIADGMRPLLARMTQSSISGALSLGAFEGLKGGVEEMFTPSDYTDVMEGSDRSASQILKDVLLNIVSGEDAKRFIKGAFERGVPSGFSGLAMVGGPLGQKISNGRGVLANALGWGTQVGVDAAGATVLNTIPKIVRGDVDWREVGKDFASNVGTFAALGLHGKAKEFASLAKGGKAWNGVEFTRKDIDLLEDRYLQPLRKFITETEETQKKRGLIGRSTIGIDADQEMRDAVNSAGAMMYNDIMRSYAVPRELKVKVAQALGMDIPEYAMKPDVVELEKQATAKGIEMGWVDAMNYDYNKPGGVADKARNGDPLTDSELTLRLLFQDNKAFNEALMKQQSGEPLTEQEQELVSTNLNRMNQMYREYAKEESGRLAHLFEEEHGMASGSLSRMMKDAAEGKAVDSNLLNEYEEMLRDYNTQLDEARAIQDAEAAKAAENTAEVEQPAEEATAEEAPKVNRVDDNAEGETPVGRTDGESTPAAPPVNQATGKVTEVELVDGRKAYVTDGDPNNPEGLISLVDENGQPIKIERNGYTFDRFSPEIIQKDKKGAPIINETKPDAVKAESSQSSAEAADNSISAKYRIPLNENAEPDYEQAKPEDTYDALVEEFGEDYATALINSEISDAKRRIPKPRPAESINIPNGVSMAEKARIVKQQMERQKNQQQADQQAADKEQAKIDYWKSVLGIPAQRKAEADRAARMEKMQTPEGRAELITNGKNTQERAQIAKEIYGDYFNENIGEPDTAEELVSMLLPYGKLNWEGYERGTSHVRGLQEELGSQHTRGLSKDKGTSGFNSYLAKKGEGESLDDIVHDMYVDNANLSGEEHRFTTEEIKDAVIDMLLSAEKPTDIRDYTINSRIDRAEKAMRGELEREAETAEEVKPEEQPVAEEPAQPDVDLPFEAPTDEASPFLKVSPGDNTFAGRLASAKEQTNTEPSEAQKEKGNYKKGHISFGGYDYVIENPEGSMRRGTDADGKKWEQKMNNTYGYILGKKGKDNDHLDMFINDAADLDNWNGNVFVVDQVNPKTGEFDEHKIMYGFDTAEQAREAYLSNYEEGWKGIGQITGVDKETFDKWLDSSDKKIKEFAEHSIIKDAIGKESQSETHEATAQEIEKAFVSKLGDVLKDHAVPYSDDVNEGQPIIDEYNKRVSRGVKISPTPAGKVTEDINGNPIRQQKVEQPMFFKTPDGHAYGFTYKGKIYVDPRIATAETPIHEYGHLWAEMKRQTSPDEWNHIKDVLLKDKLIEPIIEKVRREYPELEGKEDDFVEEVLTQFSGKHGAEKLRQMAEEIKQEMGGDAAAETIAEAAIRRVKSVLNEFWKGIADMMGWKYTSAEDIADRILSDMLNGVNPTEKMKEASKDLKGQQEIERTLMGVHNISEEKLKKALKQGGLANPSLAVFDTRNYAHTDYGEISLIPRSSLIDSRTGRNAGTFSGDAWTPTYPRVEKFLTKKGDKHRLQIAKEAAGGDEEMERHLAGVINDYVEGNGDRMHFLFLKQKGLNPEVRPERTTHSHEEFEEIQKIFGDGSSTLPSDGITKEQNQALLDLMTRGYEEQVRKQAEMIKDESKREAAVKVMLDRKLKDLVDENGNVWFAKGDSFVYENWRDEQRRKNPKPDWYGTDNDASYRVAKEGLAEEYEKWKEELLNDEDVDEKLFAGWTADGQKRYVSNTVQNASRLMNKEAEANAYGNGGVNASKSVLLKKLKTLSDIRKYRHLLKSEDQIKEQAQQASDEWFDIIQQVSDMQKIDSNQFINLDIAEARLQEAITERDPIRYLNKEYGYDIDRNSDLASELMNFIEKAKEMPVKYFETKFRRPVGIDEFAIAVVPSTTSPEVVEALKNAGLDVRTYERSSIGDENDKARIKATMDAVSGRDDILFQKKKKEYPIVEGEGLGREEFEKFRNDNIGKSIDKVEGNKLLHTLKNNAEEMPEVVEFTDENYNRLFGNGIDTPIGHVKMSDNQKQKMSDKKRENQMALAKRTLEDPDMIISKPSQAKEGQVTERPFSYVFVKTFKDSEGKLATYFFSVSVKKEGLEVSMSNYIPEEKNVLRDMREGTLAYIREVTLPSESGTSTQGDQSTSPAGDISSEGKGTKNIDTLQENQEKSTSEAQENENNSLKFQRVGSPEPEMTPEERQYWNKWDADMKKWREQNAIPEGTEEPGEKPKKQPDEDMIDYVLRLTQYNKDKAVWKTAPKLDDYLRQRSDKDAIEAARENLERYPDSPLAKMRMAAAEFQQIRTAMGQQKAYDKATVKAVTDFAQEYMKMGFGDNLSRGEMERMLSAVKNATGAKDIRKEVDNIMNILTDNYLRNLDQQVQKLSSVKELSKTAQGVEKQGKLELKGQRMIQAFREARQARMTAEEIRERMAEVSEYMARNDDEAPMWEQEYEGLSIALQYVEDIDGSRSEYGALDREYKDAVKNYRESGRSYKAQQEYLDELDKAMMENKLERIGMFGDLIGRLQGNIAESMQGAREFVEKDKQRIRNIHTIAERDMNGRSADADHDKTWKQRLNNSAIPRMFLGPLATFEQMLRQFGGKSPNGEGWLYNHFMRSYIDSVDREQVGREEAFKELDDKVSEVFGKKMRWSDLYGIERKKKDFPDIKVKWLTAEGEEKEHTLSQGNALYIYMADKMNDGRMKLRQMGIDEEEVQSIKNLLDPRFIELADWLQGDFLVRQRVKYNEVYQRVFGAPMAAIENYFPLRILGDAITRDVDVTADPNRDDVMPSTVTGSVIKRKHNKLPLDIKNTDAFSLAVEHIDDMEKWAAFVEWYKDINTLLSYSRFKNQVKNMNTVYGGGDELWDNFRHAAQLASGTYRPTKSKADKAITTIASGVTGAKIAFRPYTALKQLLSAPAFIPDIDIKEWFKCFHNNKNFWHDNIKWAMENMPVLRKRWTSRDIGDTRLSDNTGWGYWDKNVRGWISKWGIGMNAAVDRVTCAAGARAIYRSKYKRYINQGFSKEDAHKRAIQDAEIGYNLTQQSSEGAFVSTVQKDRTMWANMWSVFRNSSMAYTRQAATAVRNLEHWFKYKDDAVDFLKRQFEAEGLSEEDAQGAAEADYKRALWRNGARLAVSAYILPVLWDLGSKVPYLIFGDDDEEKKKMVGDVLRKELVVGPTEGLMYGQAMNGLWGAATSRDVWDTYKKEGLKEGLKAGFKAMDKQNVNPMPLFSDMGRLMMTFSKDEAAGFQDLMNLAAQVFTGVNPQTVTDWITACIDYSRGDMKTANEIGLLLMRVLLVPTESSKNVYIDELGMNAEDAKKLSFDQAAERYSKYMMQKNAPFLQWAYSDEAEKKRRDSYIDRFTKDVQKRIGNLDDKELEKQFESTDALSERDLMSKEEKKRKDSEDILTKKTGNMKYETRKAIDIYAKHRAWQDLVDDLELAKAQRGLNAVQKQLDALIEEEKEKHMNLDRFKTEDTDGSKRKEAKENNDALRKAVEDFEQLHKDELSLLKDINKALKEIKDERNKLTGVDGVDETWDKLRSKRDEILKKIRAFQQQ